MFNDALDIYYYYYIYILQHINIFTPGVIIVCSICKGNVGISTANVKKLVWVVRLSNLSTRDDLQCGYWQVK